MMTPSQERRARNEAVFQKYNQTIKRQAKSVLPAANREDYPISFVCECSDADCHDAIALTARQYEDIKQTSRHFIVRPGHAQPDIEKVVSAKGFHHVVLKDQAPPAPDSLQPEIPS